MKKKETQIIEKIFDYSLEEIMGDRFGRYSKYIIQDRALPDVRDGLKPVQRRILYSMYKDKNTYDRPTRKSAKSVGNVMGQYHPHGDSSIYEAMVRMSQKWKQREVLIEMQGNNGSIDGDGPAAMRYTEARLAKISNILLKDIEKDCVLFVPTFDDESFEPTVLPAHFPNLLVNGATGISAGYATNIPPHNLGEIIDATIKRIDSPDCRLDTILNIVKGPDFPTGGIIEGTDGIKKAYQTGKGKIIVSSKYEFIDNKSTPQIIITQIPYDTLKCNIIKKIEEIRLDKKIDGIVEVRDESDKNDDLRIAIDLKKDAKKDLIVKYLLKNTDMQVNYNFNVVAIVNRRPRILGILEILDAFIAHQKEVITKRSEFDLSHAEARLHIVEGFIKALDILDKIIKTIRKSKNKQDAIENLITEYDFTRLQSEAIVNMQLYKLTNTDVTLLKDEAQRLNLIIKELKEILGSPEKLMTVMKNELKLIKKEYATPRITQIIEEVTDLQIDELEMVTKEDYVVCVSASGYIKKVSIKSFETSNKELTGLKDKDYVEGFYKINNLDTILLFTNKGNYIYMPVREIPEYKYKDIGIHISNKCKISEEERIVKSIGVTDFNDEYVTIFTKNGMIKRILLKSFEVSRFSKAITMFKLKENDEVVSVSVINSDELAIISKNGYILKYKTQEVPILGLRTSGVKSMKLVEDEIINGFVINSLHEHITLFTDKSTAKRIKVNEIPLFSRAKKGFLIAKSPKSKKYNLIGAFNSGSKSIFGLITDAIGFIKSADIPIMDMHSVGSSITKKQVEDVFINKKLKIMTKKSDENLNNEDLSKEKEPQILTMSDFFEEFKL